MPSSRVLPASALPAVALALALASSPAQAQAPERAGPPAGLRDDGSDRLTIGFGLGAAPDYEGSNDYRLQPGGILQGRVSGIEFQMRGLNLYTDVIADRPGAKTRLVLGPVAQLRLDRNGDVDDPRVAALGTRKAAVELGLTAGISRRGVLIPPASLNFDVTLLRDVAGAHRSHVITPALSLNSPVSQRGFARLGVSADIVGKGFARYYYGVAPGMPLPAYTPTGGGLKSVGGSLLYTHDLSGEPRKGWGLFMLTNYKRLQGDFARSPLVGTAGSKGQLFAVAGLSYSL